MSKHQTVTNHMATFFFVIGTVVFSCLYYRLWDVRGKSCVQSIHLDSTATSIELSRDRENITVAHGNTVTIIDSDRYVIVFIKEYAK